MAAVVNGQRQVVLTGVDCLVNDRGEMKPGIEWEESALPACA